MHARSLLDYLSDAERAHLGERRDMRGLASVLERLHDLEQRLGDLRNASERADALDQHGVHDRQALRDEISSILRRRGVNPQARRMPAPPPLAPRDWVEPPPLAPVQAFHGPSDRTDPNLVKFIEAVRLLGRAADRFMADSDAPADGAFRSARYLERSAYPAPQASERPGREPDPVERSASRVSDADLVRLWEEVEALRRSLAQLSSRRESY